MVTASQIPGLMPHLREQLQRSLGDAVTLEHELGGGMSRVFVAHDERLGRKIVLKVLPLDATPAAAERFRREIATASRLQHPHIVPTLASGEAEGLLWFSMPFVEGESLRAKLARDGEFAVLEAVSVLRELARALAYAHEHGVVHRDIKPDNVLLSGGVAVVTDFGVAKALAAARTNGGGDPAAATTLTQLGVALGTPAYMAPEQASADPAVDHRADLYAFGCVAYEVLTGQPPFTGRPAQALLAAHVSEEPEPITRRRPRIPAALAALVMRCLEKRPADRPQSARELLHALEEVVTPHGTVAATPVAGTAGVAPRRVARWAPWSVAATCAIAAVALGVMLARRTAAVARATEPVRFTIALPAGAVVPRGAARPLVLSRDGRTLAMIVATGDTAAIWVRALDQLEARRVEGTEGAEACAFSPDGQWLAFVSGGEIRKVSVAGGPVVDVAALPGTVAGLTWATTGDLVLGLQTGALRSANGAQGLAKVSSAGGHIRALTRPTTAGELHVGPRLLPDGRSVVFQVAIGAARVVGIASVESGEYEHLRLADARVVGAFDGHLAFTRSDGGLMIVPVDVRRRVDGDPVPAAEVGGEAVTLSPAGTLAFLETPPGGTVVEVDERGAERTLLADRAAYHHPRISPDGRRLAVAVAGARGLNEIRVLALGGAGPARLGGTQGDQPEWTDGGELVYRRREPGRAAEIWSQRPGTGRPAARLLATGDGVERFAISHDGRTLIYGGARMSASERDLQFVTLDSTRRTTMVKVDSQIVDSPRLSPDGRWLAYAALIGTRSEVFVRPFPGAGVATQVSDGGGGEPLWSRDGRRLYYRGAGAVMAATVEPQEDGLAVAGHERLFADSYARGGAHAGWDVGADGRRFVLVKLAEREQRVAVVLNWPAELRRRAAAGQ